MEFLEECAARAEICCLAWTTVMGYLRVSTHPSIFAAPLSPELAAANVEALVRLPHVRLLSEQDGFWEVYRDVTRATATRGNFVPDAHLAALLKQHGIGRLYTHDSDFRRFEFLEVRNPFK